jgi:perosamine synthetase
MLLSRLRGPASLSELAASLCASTTGERDRFEAEFAEKFGFPEAVFFPYARGALHFLMHALGWRGREVLCPAYTCAVVAHAIELSGNRVRFVDSADDHFLAPADAWAQAANANSAMAILTPLFGYPIDRGSCEAAIRAKAPDALLLYDVAQGFDADDSEGSQIAGADAALFSFGLGKLITTLYGGMITLRDAALGRELRALRDRTHRSRGFGRSALLTLYGAASWAAFRPPTIILADYLERRTAILDGLTRYYYATDRPRLPSDVASLPTAMQARLGRLQLGRYDALVAERRRISSWYDHRLLSEGFRTFAYRSPPTWSAYPIAVADRASCVASMRRQGIQVGTLIDYACSDLPGYERHAGSCPKASQWGRSMVNLPNWPGLGSTRAGRVVDAFLRSRDRDPKAFAAPSAPQADAVAA